MKASKIFAVSLLSLTLAAGAQEKQKANPSPSDPPIPTRAMGQGLYEQNGANSCLYCHGVTGEQGKVAAAAKLTHPKAWKSYKGLGGDAAFNKNKAEFLSRLETSVVDLILKGAVAHNATYKPDYFNWKATGGPINGQMLGVSGAPSAAWIKKYQARGVTKEIAAKAVYLYLQKFDTEGVFKN